MGTGSFSGVASDEGVMLTPHPLLVLRSKNRAIPLLSLRASVACTKGETYYSGYHRFHELSKTVIIATKLITQRV
jgi:hypothetical protein